MAVDYTTTERIKQVKRLTHMPTSTGTFENADILALFNQAMDEEVVPLLRSVRENYYLTFKEYAVSGSPYRIPTRAIGAALAFVRLRNANYYEKFTLVSASAINSTGSPVTTRGFVVSGNRFYVYPDPTLGTIEAWYYERPGRLVLPTDCGQISTVDSATQFTCSSVPATFGVGTLCDIVQALPPFDTLEKDLVISNIGGTTITFSTGVTQTISPNDYICIANESPIPQIPEELFVVLDRGCAVLINESQGYNQKYEKSVARLEAAKQKAVELITPRVEEEPPIIFNDTLRSPMPNLIRYWR